VGESQVDIALLLLFTHAIAKALVFMSAGSVILTTNTQNLTEMGGLWSKMPATTTAFIVGAAGLVALMPLGTFWTMRRWVNGFWTLPLWLILVLLLVNCLTALSLTRVFGLVFAGKPQQKTRRAPEVPWPMALPLVSMTILTLLVPLMLQQWQLLISWRAPLVVAPGTGFAEIVRQATVPLLVISGLLGVAIGGGIYLLGMGSKPYKLPWKGLQDLFAYDFYIDRIYGLTVVLFVRQISAFSAWIDRYIIDGIVNAFGLATLFSGEGLKYSISGQSQFYLLTIALGVGVLMGLMLWQF
jgi:NAD(P)H-quinone oxidoreductase subunit 5